MQWGDRTKGPAEVLAAVGSLAPHPPAIRRRASSTHPPRGAAGPRSAAISRRSAPPAGPEPPMPRVGVAEGWVHTGSSPPHAAQRERRRHNTQRDSHSWFISQYFYYSEETPQSARKACPLPPPQRSGPRRRAPVSRRRRRTPEPPLERGRGRGRRGSPDVAGAPRQTLVARQPAGPGLTAPETNFFRFLSVKWRFHVILHP